MKYLIGLDENGTGALAGPFIVSAVKAPISWSIPGLNDSKQLSKSKIKEVNLALKECIKNNSIEYSLIEVSVEELTEKGLGKSLKDNYVKCLDNLDCSDSIIILDGNKPLTYKYPVKSEIKADGKYAQVMAASILGKFYRDDLMIKSALIYPGYGFEDHVGYAAASHKDAIRKLGFCDFHRRGYNIKL